VSYALGIFTRPDRREWMKREYRPHACCGPGHRGRSDSAVHDGVADRCPGGDSRRAPQATGRAAAVASSAEQDRYEDRVLRLTNAARGHSRKCGGKHMKKVRALSWSPELASSAHAHSTDMATNDFFSHTSRSGASPFDRMRAAGFDHRPIGENIAAGLAEAEAVVKAWLKSPGHCKAIMDRSARELGVGRVEGSGEYSVYWTQDFGAMNNARVWPVPRATMRA
jgi:uncharacterized protein YkwD